MHKSVCLSANCTCVCVCRPAPFRLEASVMVLQRSGLFQRLGCSGKTVFKGHHATPLHYLPAISYQFVCLIDFFVFSLFSFFLNKASSHPKSSASLLSRRLCGPGSDLQGFDGNRDARAKATDGHRLSGCRNQTPQPAGVNSRAVKKGKGIRDRVRSGNGKNLGPSKNCCEPTGHVTGARTNAVIRTSL